MSAREPTVHAGDALCAVHAAATLLLVERAADRQGTAPAKARPARPAPAKARPAPAPV